MAIIKIKEDRTAELVRESEDFVQGECCATVFNFEFPTTIKGVDILNYSKTIEFGECKDFGDCVKFVDVINGDTYDLKEFCTCFKKIMVQVVLTKIDGDNKIVWKTIPFTIDFHESVNAEGVQPIQSQLLSLEEIKEAWTVELNAAKDGWENFVNANCVQVAKSLATIPSPEDCDCAVMLYLGLNDGGYIYGHYYQSVNRGGVIIWEDLNPATTIIDVANGIRELNKDRTVQLWTGTTAEFNALDNLPANSLVLLEDDDTAESWDEIEGRLDDLQSQVSTNCQNNVNPTNDLLLVFTEGDSQINRPMTIATENAASLINIPDELKLEGQPFYCLREVYSLPYYLNGASKRKTIVKLTEAYPANGRVWHNVYNLDTQMWSGWRSSENASTAYFASKATIAETSNLSARTMGLKIQSIATTDYTTPSIHIRAVIEKAGLYLVTKFDNINNKIVSYTISIPVLTSDIEDFGLRDAAETIQYYSKDKTLRMYSGTRWSVVLLAEFYLE